MYLLLLKVIGSESIVFQIFFYFIFFIDYVCYLNQVWAVFQTVGVDDKWLEMDLWESLEENWERKEGDGV